MKFSAKLIDKTNNQRIDTFDVDARTERDAENYCLNVIAGIDTDIDRDDISYELEPVSAA